MNETIITRRPLPVSLVCGAVTVVTAVILYGYGAAVQAFGVTMHAGEIGASSPDPITPASFASGVVLCAAIGTVIAMCLARWVGRPAVMWVRITGTLAVVSLAFPLSASHTIEWTRIALAGGHLLAAAIVIPVIGRRLATQTRPLAAREASLTRR
jgi:hypothetical protein